MGKYNVIVVGAGFAGITCAERLAAKGKTVLVIDRRPHIGGNAYDETDSHGILIHKYGPHIFHTNSKEIFVYLSRFTDWRFYEHRVLSQVNGKLYPMPINRTTINRLYGLSLGEGEVQSYLDNMREKRDPIRTSEDVVLNSVGPDLCDKFFRGYTQKQWGLDLSELSAGVAARIPTRSNDDDRYFTDGYQFMPAEGYTRMFERMLEHSNIKLQLNTEFDKAAALANCDQLIYTGPIDSYFDYRFGALPYRSLRFEHEYIADKDMTQAVGTVNYPNEYDFTRITEFKHLTGQKAAGTSIVREYPQSSGDPYYPIPREVNADIYNLYRALADEEKNVCFVGRLAQYKYYNMDQVTAAALKTVSDL